MRAWQNLFKSDGEDVNYKPNTCLIVVSIERVNGYRDWFDETHSVIQKVGQNVKYVKSTPFLTYFMSLDHQNRCVHLHQAYHSSHKLSS